jgi:hypothetical protein
LIVEDKVIAPLFILCKVISGMQDSDPDIGLPFCDMCKTKLDSTKEFREHLRTNHSIPA